MSTSQDTPMFRQYMAIKKDHPDSILFYRLGDFYEMFLEDAKIASEALQLTLTGRGKDENRIPMCGIPFHAKDNYINKLIQQGFKVAICEQVEDASQSKGLTKRAVVRVITPGTILEDHALPGQSNNFLAAIQQHKKGVALALLDYSTGDFFIGSLPNSQDVLSYISQCQVKELLIDDQTTLKPDKDLLVNTVYMPPIEQAEQHLQRVFKIKDLAGFGISQHTHSYPAAHALIEYIKKTQYTDTFTIKPCKALPFDKSLTLDQHSSKHLELFEDTQHNKKNSLFAIINDTKTPMGSRKLAGCLRHPSREKNVLETRLNHIEGLVTQPIFRESIRQILSPIGDIERNCSKIWSLNNNPKDLIALKENLRHITNLTPLFTQCPSPQLTPFQKMFNATTSATLNKVITLIEKAIVDEPPSHLRDAGVIKDGYSPTLDDLSLQFKDIREWLNRLEVQEKEATSIKTLKVRYNKVFGYYIEVPKAQQSHVPDHYIRKQTLTNAERYITAELKEKEQVILQGQQQQIDCETKLYHELLDTLHPAISQLLQICDNVAKLDIIQSLAHISQQNGYCKPQFCDEPGILTLIDNVHPILANQHQTALIPNTITLAPNQNLIMLTGANMAGKSTLMRQAALTIILAQIGCYVPCKEARLSLVDRIFTRIGASDNLYAGQSTFMVEMIETANILHNATPNSFIILDEIGRGTSTYDGMSIAAAVLKHIQAHINARCLFATHYHELSHYTHQLQGVIAYRMGVKKHKQKLLFTYRLEKGTADSSYGLTVAQMAGIPETVLSEAQKVLQGLETKGLAHMALSKPSKKDNKLDTSQLFLWQS